MINLLKTLFFAPVSTALSFFAPIAEERIKFFQVYRQSIGPYEAIKQQRERYWIYLWMASAARRQERQNQLNRPGFCEHELQRRKWERSYAYGFIAKRAVFLWALLHAAKCTDPIIEAHAPVINRLFGAIAFGLRHLEAGAARLISSGHIALQAEGQPVWFRNIELMSLEK